MTSNRFTLESPDRRQYNLATRIFAELAALPIVALLFLLVFTSLPATPPVPITGGAVVIFALLVGIVRVLYLGLAVAARRAPAVAETAREVLG